jgi:hypothetical protein
MHLVKFLMYRWYLFRDRMAVRRLERQYRRHPEWREEDRHLFESGQAGYDA